MDLAALLLNCTNPGIIFIPHPIDNKIRKAAEEQVVNIRKADPVFIIFPYPP